MSIGAQAIVDAVTTHANSSGLFDRVLGHEPKSAPGNGLTASVWWDSIAPLPTASGLAATAALLTLNIRVGMNMLAEPQDAIDPALVSAVDALMTAYSGDFELGGRVRNVDLLGAYSAGLSARAAYYDQDGKKFRAMVIDRKSVV